ncbi:MAG: HDOD domain-containing protein [Candidatus Hydrogenedentes bacterium]|nr:HDOD domain-containing protein [Candidatus Hydrogenedentota bacterium]
MKRVLFVDDEINVLNGLKRMLRSVARDWSMSFAQSGEDALDAMRKFPDFDVVVTDLNMHGMSGVDFLMKVREEFPNTVRFVLSGSTDAQMILKVANVAHQFMGKPCDPQKLYHAVARAFALREQLNGGAIKSLLHRMGKLPALPVVYNQILQEMMLDDTSVARVGKLIEQDPALSIKVLQIVNSAYMGVRNPVSNLVQACSMLGLESLKNVVLMAEVFELPKGRKLPASFNLGALWNHSLTVGEGARQIAAAETGDKKIIDRAFTAGLLHEIGQLILASQLTDEFATAIRYADEKQISLVDAEIQVLGATHSQVGSYLLELWGLPDPVVEAIAFHIYPSACPAEDYSLQESGYHVPEEAAFTALTALHAANYFSEEHESGDGVKAELDMAYLENLGYADRIGAWWERCSPAKPVRG